MTSSGPQIHLAVKVDGDGVLTRDLGRDLGAAWGTWSSLPDPALSWELKDPVSIFQFVLYLNQLLRVIYLTPSSDKIREPTRCKTCTRIGAKQVRVKRAFSDATVDFGVHRAYLKLAEVLVDVGGRQFGAARPAGPFADGGELVEKVQGILADLSPGSSRKRVHSLIKPKFGFIRTHHIKLFSAPDIKHGRISKFSKRRR